MLRRIATLALTAAALAAPRAARANDAAPAPARPTFEGHLYEILRGKDLLDAAGGRAPGGLRAWEKEAETALAEPEPRRRIDPIEVDYAPDEGLTVATEDGESRLNAHVRLRTVHRYENPDDPMGSDGSSLAVRRAGLTLRGSAWRRWAKWHVRVNFTPSDGPELEDAYADLAYRKQASLQFGRFRVPTSRRLPTSTADRLLADRSDVTAEFAPGRDHGAMVYGEFGDFASYAVGVFNGLAHDAGGAGHRWAARLELAPLGAFEFDETGLDRPEMPRLAVDGALWTTLDAEEDLTAVGGADDEEVDEYSAQAGGAFAWDRVVAAGAYHWRTREPDHERFAASTDSGWFVQVGLLVHDRVRIAGRIERLRLDPDRYDDVAPRTGGRDRWALGVGADVRLLGHTVQLEGDFFQRIRRRPGPNRRDEEVRVRARMIF